MWPLLTAASGVEPSLLIPRTLMPQLHFTDTSVIVSLAASTLCPPPLRTIAAPDCPALVDGIPFILGDDGSYDLDLNRFFRECPSIGIRSPNSVRAYARDILTWLRFLTECRGGKSLWLADRQDIIAYHRTRRLSPGPGQISGSSWNRSITALERFYGWAWDEGLLAELPFLRSRIAGPSGSAARQVQGRPRSFREPAARRHDMHFIDMDRFVLFRDVGLRARLRDGSADPAWRGHNGERNALFAELLTVTGMRLEEASSLLPVDLPRHDDPLLGDARSCAVALSPAICKGGKGREIRIPRRLLRRIDDYIEIERANAVCRWRVRRGWERVRDPLGIVAFQGRGVTIDAGGARLSRRRLDVMRSGERARLVVLAPDGTPTEPAVLWLTDGGHPMRPTAWEAAFLRADARCRAQGFDLHVSPHMLRHTFAVYMLSLLIRAQLGAGMAARDQHGAVYVSAQPGAAAGWPRRVAVIA
jgi:site-specific recombinase XerD